MPLEAPELHHLNAAVGWLELGNVAEAKAELAGVGPQHENDPDVLEVRWLICAEEKRWEEGLEIAHGLLDRAPDRVTGWLHQAYALRRVPGGSVKAAWNALLPAFDRFPKEPTVSYNLACYACRLGQLDTARTWFKRALLVGGKEAIKRMALADSDLEALWEEIKRL